MDGEDGEDKGPMEMIQKEFRPDPNDDRPLTKGQNDFMVSEYPEGEGPPEIAPSTVVKRKGSNARLTPTNKPDLGISKGSAEEKVHPKVDEIVVAEESKKENVEVEEGFTKIDKPIRDDPNDSRPLGGATKFTIPEFADGEQPPENFKPKPRILPKKTVIKKDDNKGSEDSKKENNEGGNIAENNGIDNEKKKPGKQSISKPWLKKAEGEENKDTPVEAEKGLNKKSKEVQKADGPLKQEDDMPIGQKKEYAFDLDDERPIGVSSKPAGGFSEQDGDDRPLGGGNKNTTMMDEYPDGVDPDSMAEQAASKDEGPLSKRIMSKVVKTRMNAFSELADELAKKKNDSSFFDEYAQDWDKKIGDANPGAQEAACCALKSWIVNNPNFKNLKVPDAVSILKVVVEKVLGGGKPQMMVISKELFCLLFEKGCELSEVYEMLNGCVKNKNAKIVCAGIQAITDLLINYGPKKLDFMKPFFGEIEKQSLSTNSSIRTECMSFFKEAMKWLGDAIVKNYTKNLKKLQNEELDKFYAEWDKVPMIPLRASEEEKKAAGKANASGKGAQEVDLFEIADAVDIFQKFSDKWCDKVLALTKWQEKKEALEEIITAASQPKITGNGYMPVVGMIKRLLNDNMVVIQICSIKLSGCLCKSARKVFNMGAKQLFDQILIKFRDKKTAVIEETTTALDNFWYSITLEEVIEEVKEGIMDKAPPMKMQIMSMLEKYFETRPNATKSRDAFKAACLPTLKKLFDDSTQSVREQCLKMVGKFNKQKDWFTADEINTLTAGLNDQKKAKIQQGAEDGGDAAVTQNLSQNCIKMPANKPPTGTSTLKPSQKPNQDEDEEQKESKPMKSSTIGRKNEKGATPAVNVTDTSDDISSGSIPTAEESEGRLRDNGMSEESFKAMAGSKNPDKVEAIQNMGDMLDKCLLELFVYLDKVAFKSSILTIQKEVISLVDQAADQETFSKKCFHVITDFLIKNIGDPKFSSQIASIIEKSCQKLMPKYVISRLIKVLKQDEKKMSPKSAQELSKVIANIIDLASLKFFNFMDVLTFAKESVQNTNVNIKAGGQEILKKLYEHLGETLVANFLKDIPPNILNTLQKEFSKLSVLSDQDKSSRATMDFQGEAGKEIAQAAASGKNAFSANPLDQLPRADISKDADKIIKKLTDSNWKQRKEGLDELDAIIEKNNNRIQINGLFDLLGILKQSLQEANKGLQRQAFNFIGRFAVACGKDLKPHSKTLLCQIVSNLSNKETLMRKEVILALDRFEKAIGGEAVINIMPPYLQDPNPEQRSGIIEWILRHEDSYASAELNAFVTPILLCLDDKQKEIRVLAEQLLEKTIAITTPEPFKFAFKDMKPATVKVIKPIISKYTSLDDDDSTPATPIVRQQTKAMTSIIKSDPKKQSGGATPKPNSTLAPPGKTLNRNATAVNLKIEKDSDTASNNGDRTPRKSKYGMNHSHSTNKLHPKKGGSETELSANESTSSRINNPKCENGSFMASAIDDIPNPVEKIFLQQTQIEELQQQLEATKSLNQMTTSQLNSLTSAQATIHSNKPQSMVDSSSKRIFMDDSMVFPLSNSISALKQKRLSFPLHTSFSVASPSNEHFEFIQNELVFLLSPSVTPLMFSFNYKSLIYATEQIQYACGDHMQVASLKYLSDLLFQWCFMRIYGNFNIEVCLRLLDTMRIILSALSKQNEQLSDMEIGTINAAIRECLINLPERSSVFQQIFVIFNLQLKNPSSAEKVINFWLNEFATSVQGLHPLYFESDSLNLATVQEDYLNKLYELFPKAFLKNLQPNAALPFLAQLQYSTPKAYAFVASIQSTFGRDAMLAAGFNSNLLDQNKQQQYMTPYLQPLAVPSSNNMSNTQQQQQQQPFVSAQFAEQPKPQSILDTLNQNSNGYSKMNANIPAQQSTAANGATKFQDNSSQFNKQQAQYQPSPQYSAESQQPQIQPSSRSIEEVFQEKVRALKNDPYSNDKVEMLVYVNNVIQEYENPSCLALIEGNTNLLLDMIYSQLQFCFENKKDISPQYLQYFLNVMYKCFTIKTFAKNCGIEPLKSFTEEILYRLLSEDENQAKDDNSGNNGHLAANNIIKLINSTMLRILENSRPEHIYKILLELLLKYRQKFNYAKILGLIIKCILKVTKSLNEFSNQVNLGELLLYFHSYICEFLVPNPSLSDDIGVKTIKTILKELCKLKGETIWDAYNQTIKNHPQKDLFISEWITMVLRPPQVANAPMNPISIVSPRDLRFERKISASHSLANIPAESIDQQIIKTIDSIKKAETFEQGIAQLYEILSQNPNININGYLQDCTQNFTKFVISNLEKLDQQKKQQNSQAPAFNFNIPNNNNNPGEDRRTGDKGSPNSNNLNNGKQQFQQTDYDTFHNKINEFKQRINRPQYGELDGIQQQNYQSQQQGDKQYQSKTTEELLQKVIDMKTKMHSVISQNGSNKGTTYTQPGDDESMNTSFSNNKSTL